MLWLPRALLAGLLVQEVTITQALWYGSQPQSPLLPAEGAALDFALCQARRGGSLTAALFGAARVPGRHARVYGGRIHGAIQIVAVEWNTGHVYHAPAERPGAAPLAAVMKDPDQTPPGEAAVEGIQSHFNVDLRAHLGLPEVAANYAVFLWLDEMTSPVRLAQVPPPQGRAVAAPRRTPASIMVSSAGARPGWLKIQAGAGLPALSLLAMGYRSRELQWRRVRVPSVAGPGGFQLDISDLLGPAGAESKVLVVACGGGTVSNVLVVER